MLALMRWRDQFNPAQSMTKPLPMAWANDTLLLYSSPRMSVVYTGRMGQTAPRFSKGTTSNCTNFTRYASSGTRLPPCWRFVTETAGRRKCCRPLRAVAKAAMARRRLQSGAGTDADSQSRPTTASVTEIPRLPLRERHAILCCVILEIVKYGHPALREKGKRIERVTPEIRQLAADMIVTMYAADGVGLAAQQVGRPMMLTVIDISAS